MKLQECLYNKLHDFSVCFTRLMLESVNDLSAVSVLWDTRVVSEGWWGGKIQ